MQRAIRAAIGPRRVTRAALEAAIGVGTPPGHPRDAQVMVAIRPLGTSGPTSSSPVARIEAPGATAQPATPLQLSYHHRRYPPLPRDLAPGKQPLP